MTTLLEPVGTATQGQATLGSPVDASYERRRAFSGETYTVPVREDQEEDARARLAALAELAREVERTQPYYPDSPEEVEERTATVAGFYEAQLRAIAAREDQEQ